MKIAKIDTIIREISKTNEEILKAKRKKLN